ncbi:putative iron transport multicopper oxidase [Clavispora lusitaniae]|uniref:Iron transport multicopper oxidase n=2 Tax=Clavispora lusitaniae TaxID=36911 RepID=A0ACD0WFY1_CLALS|nr:ferroxidase fet3 [Clavispora lusitaniae]KAF7583592.1 Iron transport multicopper oxidase FET3 [Clavispora lusitaniae]OVF09225.1 putative iron transport multicopper oxidase [Clavispora lusitaniae]QFZ26447.1 putative iron transport multicopper oxidase [Clavispora lusitaniae]QFZ32115.1 putative iron transport multicopper oxidase [Clavispora lusitaniae]
MRAFSVFIFALLYSFVSAETHTWYFQTTWVDGNPDGVFERKVMGFNNTWPLPTLRVKQGDRVQLFLNNGFDDRNTSLHFHGLFQNGTSQMDGPEMVTQCPIAPGDTMLYNFTVPDQVGTYWYHSHTSGQYGDGLRGVFIIEEKDGKYPFEFDEEVVLTVGEWYHDTADVLIPKFLNRYNPTGAEPIPQNTLFNNTRNNTWHVEPNKTYFVRIINVGGFVSQYLYMEDHEFEIVEVDGIYVEKNSTSMIYITVAQRYGVLIHTKNETDKNYAFMNKIDDDMLDVIPKDLILNSTNYIIYDEEADKPDEYMVDELDFFDDFYLTPLNKEKLYDEADHVVTVDVVMNNLGNGVNYAFFNNVTYTAPKVPIIGTALSAGEFATNAYIYGNVHAVVLQKDDVIDIRLNNQDTGKHPFHLHGHTFQVIERGEGVPDDQSPVAFNASDHAPYPEYPMIRDTVYVNPQSYVVMRFKANNPGVWMFHCHIEWHLEQGLALIFIEAPEEMQKTESQQLTDNFKEVCKNVGVNFEGNAAGNTANYMDLSGANVQHKPLPSGFTGRGIVALVFSCIAGACGMIAISFYGMADVKNLEEHVIRDLDVDLDPDAEAELLSEGEEQEASSSTPRI